MAGVEVRKPERQSGVEWASLWMLTEWVGGIDREQVSNLRNEWMNKCPQSHRMTTVRKRTWVYIWMV